MVTFKWDKHRNMYFRMWDNRFYLIPCMATSVKCTNEFLEDNPDCGLLATMRVLGQEHMLIAFLKDTGVTEDEIEI